MDPDPDPQKLNADPQPWYKSFFYGSTAGSVSSDTEPAFHVLLLMLKDPDPNETDQDPVYRKQIL